MACYDNIIGLSRLDCPCIEDAAPTGYDTSQSGLYIADYPPFLEMDGYNECGQGSVWDVLDRAREQAIAAFTADTNAALMTVFQSRRDRFKGQIGDATGREALSTSSTYAGARIACNPVRGGTLKITAIGTLFSAAGTITAKIINSRNQQVGSDIPLTVANGFHLNTISTPIELPTYIDYDSKHEYFLVYTHNPANPAKLNTVSGCCGFYPRFDMAAPMWKGQYSGSKAWANWVMAGGWTGNSLTDFDLCGASTGTQLNGLSLQVELGCDVGLLLCNGSLDFSTDPQALSIAYAILWKSLSNAASLLLGSTKLTRTATANREYLKEARADWDRKYETNLNYIVQQATISSNDCLACKDEIGMQVATVMTT
jgi:hypothetical protein